jgi:hypothetical protein
MVNGMWICYPRIYQLAQSMSMGEISIILSIYII